eukprot:jgi/Chrzof1/6192/Cz17g15010.t1
MKVITIAAAFLVLLGCASAADFATPSEAVKSLPELSQLAAALDGLPLAAKLDSPSFIGTIFAPTDDALNSIASQTGFGVTDTTNGVINTTTLDDVLSYNVVPGQALTTADFTNGMKLKNMKGETLVVAVRGSSAARMALAGDATAMIMINNATIVKGDIAAGKAIIHEVDMILLPRTYQAVLDSITTGDLAATSEDPLADLEMSSSSDVDDMSSSTMDDPLAGLIASAGDVETEDVEDMPANATIMMAATTKPTPVVASPAPATATVVAATPRPATTTAAITSTATPATVAPQQSGATTAFLSAMLVAVPALTLLL